MRVVEEPFITRDSVLSVLRPGERSAESPFRTLRQHNAASPGVSVALRNASGHLLGRMQLYSALNADAARAFRLNQRELATAFAGRAAELEKSPSASLIRDAIATAASVLPSFTSVTSMVPPALQRFLRSRRHESLAPSSHDHLVREWLATSGAWLEAADVFDDLIAAVAELDRSTCEARADLLAGLRCDVDTFYGVVARMDSFAAEIESDNRGAVLIARGELERHGLAALDQPVALLREVLPGGGTYILPMAAVRLGRPKESFAPSPWAYGESEGARVLESISQSDRDWIDKTLAREPRTIPFSPLQIA